MYHAFVFFVSSGALDYFGPLRHFLTVTRVVLCLQLHFKFKNVFFFKKMVLMLVRSRNFKGFSFGSIELGYVLSSFLSCSEKNEKFTIPDAYLVP